MLPSMGLYSTVRHYRIASLAVLASAILMSVLIAKSSGSDSHNGIYRTAPVTRSDLLVTVEASGTVEPEEVVDVGAQVAGLILAFGSDSKGKPIDFGSEVNQGTVLARIDDSLYQADFEQAEGALLQAQGERQQNAARLFQATQDWKRAQTLGISPSLSATAFDNYRALFETATSAVRSSDGVVKQRTAAVARARRNLELCTVTSPVAGVIIDRRVNIGQTVVSNLNAPSLFLIARDLRHIEVWVSVNEADIGAIFPGQPVNFTVDAFPSETFRGTVDKIRLNASNVQNVVSYVVEVASDNSSGRLLPYLTANVHFESARRDKVLTVPTGALRWAPTGGVRGDNVWILEDEEPKAVPVKIGISDGRRTEILPIADKGAFPLSEGVPVIIGATESDKQTSANKSPFTPSMGRGR